MVEDQRREIEDDRAGAAPTDRERIDVPGGR
jgi:hypothetical protein